MSTQEKEKVIRVGSRKSEVSVMCINIHSICAQLSLFHLTFIWISITLINCQQCLAPSLFRSLTLFLSSLTSRRAAPYIYARLWYLLLAQQQQCSQPVSLFVYVYVCVFVFFFFSFWLMLYNRSSDMPHGAHALRVFVALIKWPQSGYISPSVHYPRKPLCRVIYEVIPHVIFLLLWATFCICLSRVWGDFALSAFGYIKAIFVLALMAALNSIQS